MSTSIDSPAGEASYRVPFVESESRPSSSSSSASASASAFPAPSPFPDFSPETTAPTSNASDAPPTRELRTCRICFDTSAPPYTPDPELGRLISPCTCKGSSRFVHEGCLQQWRTVAANSDNFYQCPTCHYQYQFRRLQWASFIGSSGVRFVLTSTIMLVTVWVLGFISEPILNAYLDPPSLLSSSPKTPPPQLPIPDLEPGSWGEHMLRGLTSLGLLGFLKVIYFLGPSSWWNLRNSGFASGRAATGRDRATQISWVFIAVGVLNFFVWIWKKTGGWVQQGMEAARAEILEVNPDGGEDGGEEWERTQERNEELRQDARRRAGYGRD